jgi:TPR repeat protein
MEGELPSTITFSKCAEMLRKRATARVGPVVRRRVGVITLLLVAVTLMAAPARADYDHGRAAYEVGDYAKAVAEWLPAATRGDLRAQTYLGVMYERGLGVARDDSEAVHWYRKAADQGNARAQTNLGLMYRKGECESPVQPCPIGRQDKMEAVREVAGLEVDRTSFETQ